MLHNPHPSNAKARAGISLFFFTNGAVFAGMLARFPEIKRTLELSNTQFGFLVIATSVGAMCAAGAPAYFIRRLGARATSLWFSLILCLLMASQALAIHLHSYVLFAALLFLAGMVDGIVDMGQNTHAMRVQESYGRSIINSLHALWSAGCIAAGLAGTALARAGVSLEVHLPLASAVIFAVAVYAVYLCDLPPVPAHKRSGTHAKAKATGASVMSLVPLAIIGIAGIQVEIVGNDWSANYMDGPVGWLTSDAGVAYVCLVTAQFIGRFLGDRMVDRFGRVPTASAGLWMCGVGFALAACFPIAPVVLPGFALAGFGCATIVPAVFAAADAAPGFREGSALTFVGWIMRFGNLITSPLIGFIADESTLRLGILVPLVLGVVAQFSLKRLNYEG